VTLEWQEERAHVRAIPAFAERDRGERQLGAHADVAAPKLVVEMANVSAPIQAQCGRP